MGLLEPLPLESLGPEKVRAAIHWSLDWVLNNCLPVCLMTPWTMDQRVELVRAATGWDVSAYELMKVAERAVTLARVYDIREGFAAQDDILPDRFYGPTTGGALADGGINREELREAVRMYYGMMGWDAETGVPLPAKLHELGVSWAVEYLPE